jgi:hypothetical protein
LQLHGDKNSKAGDIMRNCGARMIAVVLFAPVAFFSGATPSFAWAASNIPVNTAELDKEVRQFLSREVAAHVADIHTLDPPPDRVVRVLTIGEFSWGTFMSTLASYSNFAGTDTVAGREIAPMIAKMGLIEMQRGGLTWAQLYAAMALRHFGTNLDHNKVWQTLSANERKSWHALLGQSSRRCRKKAWRVSRSS